MHFRDPDRRWRNNQMKAVRSRRSLIAVLLGCVVAASLLATGPASAASRGFKLQNKSSVELKLIEAKSVPTYVCNNFAHCAPSSYPIDFEGRPGDGSVLRPNGTDTWELKYKFSLFGGVGYAANLWYKIVGTEDIVTYQIETYNTSNESSCKVIGTKKYTCVAGGTDLEFKN
jgi:hypothetical protein